MPYREDLDAAHQLIEVQRVEIATLKEEAKLAQSQHAEVFARFRAADRDLTIARTRRGLWRLSASVLVFAAAVQLLIAVGDWLNSPPPPPEPADIVDHCYIRDCTDHIHCDGPGCSAVCLYGKLMRSGESVTYAKVGTVEEATEAMEKLRCMPEDMRRLDR